MAKGTARWAASRWLAEFLARPEFSDECVTDWPFSRNKKGYPQILDGGKVRRVHQIVLERFQGLCPEGMQGRHLCGNGHLGCINPKHLVWGTHAENMADKAKHGRIRRASKHLMPS